MGLYNNLLQMKIFAKLAAHLVGEDKFGNKYYQEKLLFGKPQRPQRRWVIYKSGALEASAIPAKWFAWLHFTTERPLCGTSKPFEKEHAHNKTGGNDAYHPPHSLLNTKTRTAHSQAHESWTPKP